MPAETTAAPVTPQPEIAQKLNGALTARHTAPMRRLARWRSVMFITAWTTAVPALTRWPSDRMARAEAPRRNSSPNCRRSSARAGITTPHAATAKTLAQTDAVATARCMAGRFASAWNTEM